MTPSHDHTPSVSAEEQGPKIVSVAVKDQFGAVHTAPRPARHHDVLISFGLVGLHCPNPRCQGFALEDGSFVNRSRAYRIAKANGQLKERPVGGYNGPELFSEDLW